MMLFEKNIVLRIMIVFKMRKSYLLFRQSRNNNSTDNEIFTEVTQKFNEEFDSVKNILLKYGININKINFLVVKK